MRLLLSVALALTTIVGVARPDSPVANRPAELAAPEVILDGSEFNRRLFPAFTDFDGDGATDLMVGIPNRLLIYRNRTTNGQPAYAEPAWLDETVPTGRIPDG